MQIIKREDIPEKRQVRLTIAVDRDTWQASLARCYQGVKSVCPVSGEPTRENIEKQYGAIVVATGFDMINPSRYGELGYADNKDVITSLELERLMNAAGPTKGILLRPSDGKHPKTIVFVQCVGSRCDASKGKTYCSKICCMYTAKHAMMIREKYPDTDVHVFYIDVRTPGKLFDEFAEFLGAGVNVAQMADLVLDERVVENRKIGKICFHV